MTSFDNQYNNIHLQKLSEKSENLSFSTSKTVYLAGKCIANILSNSGSYLYNLAIRIGNYVRHLFSQLSNAINLTPRQHPRDLNVSVHTTSITQITTTAPPPLNPDIKTSKANLALDVLVSVPVLQQVQGLSISLKGSGEIALFHIGIAHQAPRFCVTWLGF